MTYFVCPLIDSFKISIGYVGFKFKTSVKLSGKIAQPKGNEYVVQHLSWNWFLESIISETSQFLHHSVFYCQNYYQRTTEWLNLKLLGQVSPDVNFTCQNSSGVKMEGKIFQNLLLLDGQKCREFTNRQTERQTNFRNAIKKKAYLYFKSGKQTKLWFYLPIQFLLHKEELFALARDFHDTLS